LEKAVEGAIVTSHGGCSVAQIRDGRLGVGTDEGGSGSSGSYGEQPGEHGSMIFSSWWRAATT